MITIKFPDSDTELEALGFLLGRFPGRALKTGEVLGSRCCVTGTRARRLSIYGDRKIHV